MKKIEISAEFDWIVKSAIQSKLEAWQAISDADCDGFKNLKANRDFVIECCEKVLAELDAWKTDAYGYKFDEVGEIMDAKRDLVEANGGWADVSDAVVVKEGE